MSAPCPMKFRLVVGEVGNEHGHVVTCNATVESGAQAQLRRELAKYQGDGWGRVEVSTDGENWERLP